MIKKTLKRGSHLLGPIVATVILYVLLCFHPKFLGFTNQINILRQMSVNLLLGTGMMFVLLTAQIDLSLGSILGFSSSVLAVLYRDTGVNNPFILISVCLAVGVICGLVNGLLYTKLRLPNSFVSTMAMMQILRGCCVLLTNQGPTNNFTDAILYIGRNDIGFMPICFLLALFVTVFASVFLNRTTMGRNIYLTGGNFEAARLSGVKTDRVINFVFMVSGFLAALAGLVLIGRLTVSYPSSGQGLEMQAVAAVVIGGGSFAGGKGSAVGTFIGAVFIALLNNGLNLLGARSSAQQIALGLMLLLAVLVDIVRHDVGNRKMLQEQEKVYQQLHKNRGNIR
ncbi:ABC transporter permease [Ruminococcus sp. OA3]|uniref:ABC transporter permease n=1 Tax=Ruminococcus sp. OA3 TaxID=2914164 RepID=UPI001F0581B2|nr:ABC transporter permease [Ruminococcus sp. OA3]MCH1982392.1 ABC transporter permease [Ruminococcus sp. OA3]